jgi:2-methylcitrate dehydratase
MTMAECLASFAAHAGYESLSEGARQALKAHVLDAVACALGALRVELVRMVRAQIDDFGGASLATCIGGGRTAPDRAAFHNGALVRYLDYNDAYLAPGETCHPSDNLPPVLAAAEYADRGGSDLLTALAVAYQVQCRLSDVAPVRHRGFDHTTQGAYAVAAGVARALGLAARETAHAVAISGTAFNALRVTRTGRLSHWKGLAYPSVASSATNATFLAMRGVTGPLEVFEGNKGFMESISGSFEIDWEREDLDRVRRTILKKYDAEIHSQSALEGILELRIAAGFEGTDVERIELETFDVAYHIIGGGEEGDKRAVSTKEEADHSLPYMVAVAVLDGEVTPAQYRPERIAASDVQALLRRVVVRPADDLSGRFPDEMPCRVRVILRDGRRLETAKRDYEGFVTRPMTWERVTEKFTQLAAPHTGPALRRDLLETVAHLEAVRVRDLCGLLARVGKDGVS